MDKGSPEKDQNKRKTYHVRLPGFIIEEEAGLGDVVKRVTYAFGIRPSSGCGCEHRAVALNRRLVFSGQRRR